MNQSLHYITRPSKNRIENPPLLMMLHGYGSNELDLFSFADELPDEFLIVSVRAPYEMGFGGYAWYDIHLDAENGKFSNLEQAKKSLNKIAKLLDALQREYQPKKTFLLGFSQGAILSYALSFHYPNKVEHTIALSGYLNQELLPENIKSEIKTDFYISHGSVDQVIPVDWARKTVPFLKKIDIKASYSEYPVGHGVSPQNFYSFKTWIEERL